MDTARAPGIRRREQWSAALGFVAWLAMPLVPARGPTFASLEHVFAFLPLVTFPLALALIAELTTRHGDTGLAGRLQPVAAGTLCASFFVEPSTLAGALAGVWLCTGALAAIRTVRARPGVNLVAAHVFLVVGAVWLLLARVGARPLSFTPTVVMLAAVHFHFSGFSLQVILAATGRRARNARMTRVHRFVTIAVIAAIPLIALGNALAAPGLKFFGVATMTTATLLLAPLTFGISCGASSSSRLLLRTAAGAVVCAMLLAGVYGVGELTGHCWIEIPRMAQIHGVLNAVGFTSCALLGHLAAASSESCGITAAEPA